MLSHLRRVMSEFITSETGFVRQRTGLPVAWAAGVLVAAVILLGTPEKAAAHCSGGGHVFSGCTDASCSGWCIAVHGCPSGICTQPNVCVCQ